MSFPMHFIHPEIRLEFLSSSRPSPRPRPSKYIVIMAQTEDLSMDEIDNLLKRAEVRLREAAALASSVTELSNSSKMAQLRSEGLPRPYIQTKGDISQAEQKSLVPENMRQLAQKPRKIHDPLIARQRRKEKGKHEKELSPILLRPLLPDENFPISFLMQITSPFWASPAPMILLLS